jgi:hypothetical protein
MIEEPLQNTPLPTTDATLPAAHAERTHDKHIAPMVLQSPPKRPEFPR